MKRYILFLIAIASPLLLGACFSHFDHTSSICGLMTSNSSHAPAFNFYRTPSGVIITPVFGDSADEIAELFNAKYWKFDIKSPDLKKKLKLTLELRYKGKRVTSLVNTLPGGATHYQCLVALAPTGESIMNSGKLKYAFRISALDRSVSVISASSSVIANNLFSKCILTQASVTPIPEKNGNWTLYSGWNAGKKKGVVQTTRPANTDLVFRVQDI